VQITVVILTLLSGLGIINSDTTISKLVFLLLTIALLVLLLYMRMNVGSVVVE